MFERLKRFAEPIFTATLILADVLAISLAFWLGYLFRVAIKWPTLPENIQPFGAYVSMLLLQIGSILVVSSFYGLYRDQRTRPMVDEAASIAGAVSIGILIGIALTSFVFKNSILELN